MAGPRRDRRLHVARQDRAQGTRMRRPRRLQGRRRAGRRVRAALGVSGESTAEPRRRTSQDVALSPLRRRLVARRLAVATPRRARRGVPGPVPRPAARRRGPGLRSRGQDGVFVVDRSERLALGVPHARVRDRSRAHAGELRAAQRMHHAQRMPHLRPVQSRRSRHDGLQGVAAPRCDVRRARRQVLLVESLRTVRRPRQDGGVATVRGAVHWIRQEQDPESGASEIRGMALLRAPKIFPDALSPPQVRRADGLGVQREEVE
mmetsp:Transcript_10009/g.40603  ORF Transcript_10009/g.40603 Transcript_10009/m.40603 type:complete len:262 (+) Transcript_10009:483-1268(+)